MRSERIHSAFDVSVAAAGFGRRAIHPVAELVRKREPGPEKPSTLIHKGNTKLSTWFAFDLSYRAFKRRSKEGLGKHKQANALTERGEIHNRLIACVCPIAYLSRATSNGVMVYVQTKPLMRCVCDNAFAHQLFDVYRHPLESKIKCRRDASLRCWLPACNKLWPFL